MMLGQNPVIISGGNWMWDIPGKCAILKVFDAATMAK